MSRGLSATADYLANTEFHMAVGRTSVQTMPLNETGVAFLPLTRRMCATCQR